MAAITGDASPNSRVVNRYIRLDMTPMVDLGFLLITFFIFTSSLSESKALSFITPIDGGHSVVGESSVLTLLLAGNNKIIAYEGNWTEALSGGHLKTADYSVRGGIGKVIRQKIRQMKDRGSEMDMLTIIIKPARESSYGNLINTMDEILIHDIKRYVVTDPTNHEQAFVTAGDKLNGF